MSKYEDQQRRALKALERFRGIYTRENQMAYNREAKIQRDLQNPEK